MGGRRASHILSVDNRTKLAETGCGRAQLYFLNAQQHYEQLRFQVTSYLCHMDNVLLLILKILNSFVF